VLYNLTSIAFLFGLAAFVPTAGHALAWGVSVSGVLQLALVVWAVREAGMRIRLPRPRLTPQMRLLFRRMGPGLIGAGVTQLNLAVDVVIGSLLPAGTVSILYYADRVNQLPLGVIGVAVGTALLPALSRQARAGEAGAALSTLNRAIEYALVLTLPAALALLAVPGPILGVLFGRGAFGASDVHRAAQALAAYAAGLPAFVLVKVLVPGFFARGDTAMPVRIGIGVVVLNLALNLALMVPLQHLGPPIASSLAAWANVAVLSAALMRRGHMAPDAALRRTLPRMLAAGLAMFAALWLLEALVFAPLAAAPLWRWGGLGVLVAGGLAAYGAAGQAVGAFDLRRLAAVRGRGSRGG
jgi:putative peptidoglycan lipid II flippase